MQDRIRRRGGLASGLTLALAVSIGPLSSEQAMAQLDTGGVDINQLFQQFGPLLGLTGGLGTGTDGLTGDTGDGTTTTPTTTTTTGAMGRQPLTTELRNVGREGLNNRRPGQWIQNAIAVHNGTDEFITGDVPEETPNFFRETFDTIAMDSLDLFSTILTAFNGLLSAGTGLPTIGGTDDGNGGTTTTIPNPATTGAGTTTPIQ